MKRYLNLLFIACTLSALLSACADEDNASVLQKGTVRVTVEGSEAATRATEAGNTDENFVSTLELFFFDAATKQCISVQKVTVNGTPGTVNCSLPISGNYDVYAIASFDTGLTAATATVEKLKALKDTRFVPEGVGRYDFDEETDYTTLRYLRKTPSSSTVDRPIPMWTEMLNYRFTNNKTLSVSLKRTVAKIRVKIKASSTFTQNVGSITESINKSEYSIKFSAVGKYVYMSPDIFTGEYWDYPWAGAKANKDILPKDPNNSNYDFYVYLNPNVSKGSLGSFDTFIYLCMPYVDKAGKWHYENYYVINDAFLDGISSNTIYNLTVTLDGQGSLTDPDFGAKVKTDCSILPWTDVNNVSGDIKGSYLKLEKTDLTMLDKKSAVLNFETDAATVKIDWSKVSATHNFDRVTLVNTSGGKGKIEFKWNEEEAPVTNFADKITLSAGNIKKEVQLSYAYTVPSFPNCYIVKPGASVTIPVRGPLAHWELDLGVKFNSSSSQKVEILWESIAGSTPVSAGTVVKTARLSTVSRLPYSTKLEVTAGATSGNGVVAYYVDNVLRWSWHIWVIDPAVIKFERYHLYSKMMWMDRNLGAITADPKKSVVETYGLYYQYGRKDPYPGPAIAHNDKNVTDKDKYPVDIGTVAWRNNKLVHNNGPGLAKDFIINPLTLYRDVPLEGWSTNNNKKSVYDPCPEGWYVPINSGSGLSPWDDIDSNKGFVWNASLYGRVYQTYDETSGYYPAAGCLVTDDQEGKYTPLTHSSTGVVGVYRGVKAPLGLSFSFSELIKDQVFESTRHAMPMRCCRYFK